MYTDLNVYMEAYMHSALRLTVEYLNRFLLYQQVNLLMQKHYMYMALCENVFVL